MTIRIDEDGVLSGIESIVCSIKPDGDSTESKSMTLDVDFSGMTLAELVQPALKSIRIAWQNGPGRKQFASWTNAQHVPVDGRHPGKTATTPENDLNRMLAKGMTKDEIIAMLNKIA
jgi:hypothetical protein